MSARSLGMCLALLCLSQAAFAQDINHHAVRRGAAASRDALDASMARLAARAAFQAPAEPTQQELLGVILLMSIRQEHRI